MKTLQKLLWLPVLLIPVVLALSVGCPGDYEAPPTLDSATGDGLWWPQPDSPSTKWDTNPQYPDQGYQWPDAPPSQPDAYQWPDTYSGAAPFGCKNDNDCFGLKCCPTPWGVKLCAEVCQNQK